MAAALAGLIAAAPSKKSSPLHLASQQVEAMVTQKMRAPEYIILCLEDVSDWSNATTRRVVMSVRLALSPASQRLSLPDRLLRSQASAFAGGPNAVTDCAGVHEI
jgi:hypothetical protein